MAFVNRSNDGEWFHELGDILDYTGLTQVPPSLHHYTWASEFCMGKDVLELDCRSGVGISIMSKVAARCVGIDKNREAIKYAMRNFHVEGTTRFTVANDYRDLAEFDVIVSFNGRSDSATDLLASLATSFFRQTNHTQSDKTLIFGILDDVLDLGGISDTLSRLGSDSDIRSSLFQQSSKDPFQIRLCEEVQVEKGGRLIAVMKGRSGTAAHTAGPPAASEQQDLVSIVIPTYNRADLVGESIESALNQSYPNVEVIVVDDGSVDNTKEAVAKYADRIRYYYKPNGGIGSALNHGIRNMNGRWFKWLSSDDLLTQDAVESLLTHAKETGALILYTDYEIIDGEGKFVRRFVEPRFSSYYEYAAALWTRFIGNGGSSLIEKSCFEEVGLFDESLRSAEDYDWWLRACLLHGYRFFHIPRTTLRYRTHDNQLTAAVIDDAYVRDENIKKGIKRRVIEINPEWWRTLVRYQKIYSKNNQRGNAARRLLRRSLLYMPEGIRKSALKTWQSSLKPMIDSKE